jgi:hypothetical protein
MLTMRTVLTKARRARALLAGGALVLASLTASAETRAPATSCTMTLDGAVKGTFACVASVGWNSATSMAVVAIVAPRAAPMQSINAAIERPGEPHAGAWKESDAGAVAGIVVQSSGEPRRAWTVAAGSLGAGHGSYTLTLASVAPGASTPEGKGYDARGELRATLIADRTTKATGTVTMRVQF